jgi:predicted nucleotidyltransferase
MGQQRKRELPPQVAAALSELKAALADIYGERLRGLYLYGSYARGDFDPESSDIDVLVVLAAGVRPGEGTDRSSAVISDICLKYDVLISTVPVSTDWARARWNPFLVQVRKEAVPV